MAATKRYIDKATSSQEYRSWEMMLVYLITACNSYLTILSV